MKKSIWIFLFAVLLPGGVLGWLALRSAGEQQIIFERRTAELYQKETEDLATAVRDIVHAERRAFSDVVHRLLGKSDAQELARDFTNTLGDAWQRKAIGFAIGPDGKMLSPSAALAKKDTNCQDFLWNNGSFLCSTQRAVVYPVPIDNVGNIYSAQLRQRAQSLNDAGQFSAQNVQMQQVKSQAALPSDPEGRPALVVNKGDSDVVIVQKPQSAANEPEPQKYVKHLIPPKPSASPAPKESPNRLDPAVDKPTAANSASDDRKADRFAEKTVTARGGADPGMKKPRLVAEEDPGGAVEKTKPQKSAEPMEGPAVGKAAAMPQQRLAPAAPAAPAPAPVPKPAGDVRMATSPAQPYQTAEAPRPSDAVTRNPEIVVKAQTAFKDSPKSEATEPAPSGRIASSVQQQSGPSADVKFMNLSGIDGGRQGLNFGGLPNSKAQEPLDREFTRTTAGDSSAPRRNVFDEIAKATELDSNATGTRIGADANPANSQAFVDGTQNGIASNTAVGLAANGAMLFNRQVMPVQDNRAQTMNWSAVVPATADFRGLTANADEGMISRFVQDKLGLIFWIRPPEAPEIVFGCLIEVANLRELWADIIANGREPAPGSGKPGFVLALLDDKAHPVSTFPGTESTRDWKHPFVASEIGEALPHWETALYLATPTALADSARGFGRTLSFTIYTAFALIALGGWLVVAEVRRQLALAQKKTDFVSNVSHELKTPLTSIRMFAELMHDRPPPAEKQGQYLRIITAEAERLTRLINNVLDFAKLERRQKRFEKCSLDLHAVITRVWEGHEMHLRDSGFATKWEGAPGPYPVTGDEDALAGVLVNLLSNAEKYSSERKEVELVTWIEDRCVHVSVLDRGIGVPEGEERKIFESFYRAHDSLSSGIQGSGLGLTLAQRLAREHGGEIVFERRKDGGSRFTLRLPIDGGTTDE